MGFLKFNAIVAHVHNLFPCPVFAVHRLQYVISFFHMLTEKKDIPHNPFVKLARKPAVDGTRNTYIDADTIFKVMEYAPDAEWRLIIALWRFAGLRAVSEVLTLKWEDILWDQKKMIVTSPKTEHHPGKETRIIPFFPHIEKCLLDAAEQAEEGAVYVVEKHAPLSLRGQKVRKDVSGTGNLGTMFAKIIHRAGVVRWKKLLHNLRASFETDLLNGEYGQFGLHTIVGWLGHSVKVMLEHYGRIRKTDYDQIELACQQVNRKEHQAHVEPHLVQYLAQNEGLGVEHTTLPTLHDSSLNTSVYTAAEGGIEQNREKTPLPTDSTQPFDIKGFRCNKRQEPAHSVNPKIPTIGGGGN